MLDQTINDVLYGIIWCGLTRCLKVRHPQTLQDGAQVTGLCPINIREKPGVQDLSNVVSSSDKIRKVWGNKFAMVLLPVTYYKREWHPLIYTAQAKAVMDRKKRSMEAQLYYNMGHLIFALFGTKVTSHLHTLYCIP
ncbi:O-acyltransferase WSD1 [Bienertia sinuspersici]